MSCVQMESNASSNITVSQLTRLIIDLQTAAIILKKMGVSDFILFQQFTCVSMRLIIMVYFLSYCSKLTI